MSPKNKKIATSITMILLVCVAVLFRTTEVEVNFSQAQATNPSQSISGKKVIEVSPGIKKENAFDKNNSTAKRVAGKSQLTEQPALSHDAREVICKFNQINSSVPHRGNVQIFAAPMTPFFNNKDSNIVWIKSDECPDDLYSIVHFSDSGDVKLEIDCRDNRVEDIAAFSGEQGNIIERKSSGPNWNIAISGNGYFTFQCPNDEIMLSRDGRLKKTEAGFLKNTNGCVLLNESGLPWSAELLEDNGSCNIYRDCIGFLDPSFDEIYGLKYLNSYSFIAIKSIFPKDSITKKGPEILRPKIFHNSVEDLWSPHRGRTTVSWINHPIINLEEVDCEDNEL